MDTFPPYLFLNETRLITSDTRPNGVFTNILLRAGLIFGPYLGIVTDSQKEDEIYTWGVSWYIYLSV